MATASAPAGIRSFVETLMAATSLTRPRSPFESFGALAVAPDQPFSGFRNHARNISTAADITAEQVRERIRSFVRGRFAPESLNDLVTYLGERFLKLEARIYGKRPATNYVVDQVSKKAVPAAEADPRLSRAGLLRMFGHSVDSEVRARQEARKRDPRRVAAFAMRSALLPYIRSAAGAPAFNGWDEIRFMVPIALKDRQYTVQGDRGFVGRVHAHASSDPTENLAMMRKARAEGLKLILPAETKENLVAGRLTPGMPIIYRQGAIPAEMIDPSLSHASLSQAYGETLCDSYRSMGDVRIAGAGLPADRAERLRADEFRNRFARRRPSGGEESKTVAGPAFGGLGALPMQKESIVLRSDVGAYGRENLAVWDASASAEVPMDVRMLPVGTYSKEDSFGLLVGHVRIDEEGAVLHLDGSMMPHNPCGPAYDPAPGSDREARWAMDGEWMTATEFRARREAPEEVPAAPEASPARSAPAEPRKTPGADLSPFSSLPAPAPAL